VLHEDQVLAPQGDVGTVVPKKQDWEIIAVILDLFEEGILAKIEWEWLRNKKWRRK